MIPVWVYYPTVLGVLYRAWKIYEPGGQPHRSQQDLQLHTPHSLVVQWFLKPIVANVIPIIRYPW